MSTLGIEPNTEELISICSLLYVRARSGRFAPIALSMSGRGCTHLTRMLQEVESLG
jgi:hypothetical protein